MTAYGVNDFITEIKPCLRPEFSIEIERKYLFKEPFYKDLKLGTFDYEYILQVYDENGIRYCQATDQDGKMTYTRTIKTNIV